MREHFFRSALELDPTFARAHAGLSFTHFQNVFLGLTPDRDRQMELALETAAREPRERTTAIPPRTGRWAARSGCAAIRTSRSRELQRSVELSPNFALGHYTLGFVQAQSGDPRRPSKPANTSRQLSPFDPLQFGMLGSRALAHLRLGERDEAARLGGQGRRPPQRARAHPGDRRRRTSRSPIAATRRASSWRVFASGSRATTSSTSCARSASIARRKRLLRSSARRIGFDG